MSASLIDILVAIALVALVIAASEVGYRIGARRKSTPEERSQVGVLQASMLGLLGLLLGLAFSNATSRFIQRQNLVVQEGNAMGTFFLRADLLSLEHRDAIQRSLRQHADARIELFREKEPEKAAPITARIDEINDRLWQLAVVGVRERPEVMMGVLPPLNELIDQSAVRSSLSKRHLPGLVVMVLVASAMLSMACMGYGSGLVKRHPQSILWALATLIAMVLWITFDLDYPRHGMIRLSEQPLLDARESMR